MANNRTEYGRGVSWRVYQTAPITRARVYVLHIRMEQSFLSILYQYHF